MVKGTGRSLFVRIGNIVGGLARQRRRLLSLGRLLKTWLSDVFHLAIYLCAHPGVLKAGYGSTFHAKFVDLLYRSQVERAKTRAARLLGAIDRTKLAMPSLSSGTQLVAGGNLRLVRALGIPLHIVVQGHNGPEWDAALSASAPVWTLIPGIARVTQSKPGSAPRIPPPEPGGAITLVLPMLEPHMDEVAGCPFKMCATPETIQILQDKALFAALAKASDSGIRDAVPDTYETLQDVRFPCVVKSTGLNSGLGIFVAHTPEQMLGILGTWRRRFGPQIVQAAVDGKDEFVTHAVFRRGRLVWSATFERRLEGDLIIRGPETVRAAPQVPTPAVVSRFLGQLAARLAYDGPLNADYKVVARHLHIFEVNPRLGGSLMLPEHVDRLAEALEAMIDGALDRAFAEIIRRSPLFQPAHYAGPIDERLPGEVDPALHYLLVGATEGRDPGPAFSTWDYLRHNPEAVTLGCNALLHHELTGRSQDRVLRSPGRNALTLGVRRMQAGNSQAGAPPKVRMVSAAEAQGIINSLGLVTVADSWHHSWNLETFWDSMFHAEVGKHTYVFNPGPSYLPSSPLPMFSDDPALDAVMGKTGRFGPYWYLRLGTFENFLDRRTRASGVPRNHFPTTYNYEKTVQKAGLTLVRASLRGNEKLFISQFTRYKPKKYNFAGDDAYKFYVEQNQRTPREWFFVYMLMDKVSGDCAGVALTIEDGRSVSVMNIATRPGAGVLLLVEMTKILCAHGCRAMDGGVTPAYGSYKSMIFLDSLRSDATGFIPLCS